MKLNNFTDLSRTYANKGHAFAFASVIALATGFAAEAERWDGGNDRPKISDVVKEARRHLSAELAKTSAYRSVTQAAALYRKLASEMRPTLDHAKAAEADGVNSAATIAAGRVLAAIKAEGVHTLTELEIWLEGEKASKAEKSAYETILSKIEKKTSEGALSTEERGNLTRALMNTLPPSVLEDMRAHAVNQITLVNAAGVKAELAREAAKARADAAAAGEADAVEAMAALAA